MDAKKGSLYQGTCRICLTRGKHRDIMKEYQWNGIQEVYFDILLECFNLFLITATNASNLICYSCVQRLRDANSFRAQVVASEKNIMAALEDKSTQGTLFVNVPVTDQVRRESDVKLENQVEVKEEPIDNTDEMSVDQDSDDFPLKRALDDEESDQLKREEAFLTRFPRKKIKLLPTRDSLYSLCSNYVKHLDLLKNEVVMPQMITKLLIDGEERKPMKKVYITEKLAHVVNASTLLEFSNATPFKSKSRSGFPCFYCHIIYESLDKLRTHQSQEHVKSEIKQILSSYGAECLVVYVDITNLKCTICNVSITNLNELKNHLTKVHEKKMHLGYPDRVIPFKLPPEADSVFECQICCFNFETFGSIERHMNVHYRNYVCKECGTGFITKYRLKVHSKSMHVGGNFPCETCQKVYSSQQKYKNHVDTVHKQVKRFKCAKCPERFTEYFKRQKHMVQIHGVAPLLYKCNVCEKSFDRRYTLSRHMKRDHLEERDFQCDLCSYKCFTNNELRVHMIKHNGERIFECSVCKKSYARKKTLKEHMRIHNNDRRFVCPVCGQAFVQKCSLKGHMKTHHIEYTLQ